MATPYCPRLELPVKDGDATQTCASPCLSVGGGKKRDQNTHASFSPKLAPEGLSGGLALESRDVPQDAGIAVLGRKSRD